MFITMEFISKWLFRWFIGLSLTVMGARAPAFDCSSIPAPYEANYSVTRNGDPDGSMHVLLERTPAGSFSYISDSYVKWGVFTAHIVQRSDFGIKDGLLSPVRFESTQQVSIYKRRESVEFDWTAMKATGAKKRDDFELDIRPGLQDKLTVYLQLARLACRGESDMDMDVVSGPELKAWDYRLLAVEALDTVLGGLQALHVRRGSSDDEKQTDLWLAAETGFMPVKMVYRDGDIITDMRLKDISFSEAD
jgi:hypothetical protein